MPRLTKIDPPPTDADMARSALAGLRDSRAKVARLRICSDLESIISISRYLIDEASKEVPEFPLAGLCLTYKEFVGEIIDQMAESARDRLAHEAVTYGAEEEA